MAAMDATDRKILTLLQENAAQPVAEVARKVGLSVTPCWRRIQRLEETGVIRNRQTVRPDVGLLWLRAMRMLS